MHVEVHACLARICLHAYAMHGNVDVGMQVHLFMYMSAYVCICMYGMHIPLAGAADPRDHTMGGGAPRKLGAGTYIYVIYIYIYSYIFALTIALLLIGC